MGWIFWFVVRRNLVFFGVEIKYLYTNNAKYGKIIENFVIINYICNLRIFLFNNNLPSWFYFYNEKILNNVEGEAKCIKIPNAILRTVMKILMLNK